MCDPGDNTTKIRRNTAKMSAILWMGRVWEYLELTYLYYLEMCYILHNKTAHCKNEKKGDHFWMDCLLKKTSNTLGSESLALYYEMEWSVFDDKK